MTTDKGSKGDFEIEREVRETDEGVDGDGNRYWITDKPEHTVTS